MPSMTENQAWWTYRELADESHRLLDLLFVTKDETNRKEIAQQITELSPKLLASINELKTLAAKEE